MTTQIAPQTSSADPTPDAVPSGLGFSPRAPSIVSSISTRQDHERFLNPDEDSTKGRDYDPTTSSKGKAKAATEETNLRNKWDTVIRDFGEDGKPHRKAAVLMISWAEGLDDLHTSKEVDELEAVFVQLFHYTVIKAQLIRGKPPAVQVNSHLARFVEDHDSDSTLLIVYYAGHGIPGENPGELHLTGRRVPDEKYTARNALAWHNTEHILRDATGDILLIFDCCYAGHLVPQEKRGYWAARSFEFLAACGSDSETNMPGPKSFTTALIWALTNLVTGRPNRPRFTTLELQTKIMNEAPLFPRDQYVPVYERDEPCDQRLVLAPLPTGSEANSPLSTPSHRTKSEVPQNYLDLRFWYSERPDEDDIENLADRLKRLMRDQTIHARRIGWRAFGNIELERNELELARPALEKWMSLALGRKSGPSNPPCINGTITVPAMDTRDSRFTGSHSNQSSISDTRLRPDPPAAETSGTAETNTGFAEQQADLETNKAKTQKEQTASHQLNNINIKEDIILLTRELEGAALGGIRSIHPPTLLLTALLSFGVWYAFH